MRAARGNLDKTALHMAAGSGFAECVRTLLAGGADPELRDKQGMTAREWAVQRKHAKCVEVFDAYLAAAAAGAATGAAAAAAAAERKT